jgi:hypothetical protein
VQTPFVGVLVADGDVVASAVGAVGVAVVGAVLAAESWLWWKTVEPMAVVAKAVGLVRLVRLVAR